MSWCIIIYGLAASVLPVWLLLAPRDYLSTFMKVGTIALLALGILLARPVMGPGRSQFATAATGPVFAGRCSPFLFITMLAARCRASTADLRAPHPSCWRRKARCG